MTVSHLHNIIPKPVSVTAGDGVFTIRDTTTICANDDAAPRARQLVAMLSPATGWALRVSGDDRSKKKDQIVLRVDPDLRRLGSEGYRLEISPDAVELLAATSAGLYWAIETLRQLLPTEIYSPREAADVAWRIPCGSIEDRPRFAWRGMMLDCCRHFMPIEFIYRWIDLLAIHKMNVFHWHLTDDQGWRIEIKKYPKLTEIGGFRRDTLVGHALPYRDTYAYDGTPHGGFYSQEQIRQVVAYAAARNVTIVPEIEMPGHAQAAIAAYPHLGNTDELIDVWNHWGVSPHIFNVEESTIEFLQDVLREVIELFPSKHVHVGGDEAIKDQWKASPRVQARMKELGVKDVDGLQSWFVGRMNDFLMANGRQLVGWDEILDGGLAPGAMVVSWRGEAGGIVAANAGHDVVMAPQDRVYFDHHQARDTTGEPLAIGGYTPIERVYEYEPIPAALSEAAARHVLGAQAQLWTEYVLDPRHAEYMAFPRACAMSEVVWATKDRGDFAAWLPRLKHHLQRLQQMGVNYRPIDSL